MSCEIFLQLDGIRYPAIASGTVSALLPQLGKVCRRWLIPDGDIDFAPHHHIIGNLIIAASLVAMLLQKAARIYMMKCSTGLQ